MYVYGLRVDRIHGAKGGKWLVLDPGQGLGKKVRDVVPSRDMLNAELIALDAIL
jgi:hypothetical protein